ncbi:MAG: hypothetical protein LBB88_10995 [Planctomycetaceae bacterium]|jgi:hypothetical protein|nr:hypothetical protein [Planctomycetaceae bacterium]
MDDQIFNRNVDVAKVTDDDSGVDQNDGEHSLRIESVLIDNACNPKRVQGDSGSVEQHSLQDQIAVERFLESKKATRNKGLGIRFFKISPDGSI